MKNILLGGALAGVLLFAWSVVSWTVLPWRHMVIHELPNEGEIISTLKWRIGGSGVYAFPSHTAPGEKPEAPSTRSWAQRAQEGPVGMLFYDADGMDPANPIYFLRGLGLNLLAGMFASTMLASAAPTLRSYWKRIIFVTLIGVIAAIVTHLSAWNWMHHQRDYALAMAADTVIGWVIAGAALAAIMAPRKTAAQSLA